MRACTVKKDAPIALVGVEVRTKFIYDRPALEEALLRALGIGADDVHYEPVLVLAADSLSVPLLELLPYSSLIRLRILQIYSSLNRSSYHIMK